MATPIVIEAGVPSSDGVVLHVESAGPASADHVLVLVHGGPGLSIQTLHFFYQLAGRHLRVVGYDQRGAGSSTPPTNGDFSLQAQLSDLNAVRTWAGADQVALLGHSWGAVVAAAYTARFPARVSQLVLVDPLLLDVKADQAGFNNQSRRINALVVQHLIPAHLPPVVHDSCLASVEALTPAYLADPRMQVNRAGLWGGSCTSSAGNSAYNGFVQADLPALLRQLAQWPGRALVMEGDRDLFGLIWLRTALQELPAAQRTAAVIPFAGHFPWVERPTAVLRSLQRFLT